jgi:hypothetical protein
MKQIGRLESVERRWLGNAFASLILSAFILIILIPHVTMANVLEKEAIGLPGIQALIILAACVAVIITSLSAIVDYFAVAIHVERQVIITKKRRRREEEENDEE